MPQILITSRGKSKRVEVSIGTHMHLAVLRVFFPRDTKVKLGKYSFYIREIDPWPKPLPPENTKLF